MTGSKIKDHIVHLNSVLADYGVEPVQLREPGKALGGFAAPGNRSDKMPGRQARWEGRSLPDIVQIVLDASDSDYDAEAMVREIYEITNAAEAKAAKRSLRSTLATGALNERWEKTDRGRYRSKRHARQEALAGV